MGIIPPGGYSIAFLANMMSGPREKYWFDTLKLLDMTHPLDVFY